MWIRDLLQLPPGVKVLVAVMLWPAAWAGVLMAIALAGDLMERKRERVVAGTRSAPQSAPWR